MKANRHTRILHSNDGFRLLQRMRRIRLPFYLLIFSIVGCQRIEGVTTDAVERAAAYNDAKARLLKRAPCDISIASSLRELSPSERRLIYTFCGLEAESPVPMRPSELPAPPQPGRWGA